MGIGSGTALCVLVTKKLLPLRCTVTALDPALNPQLLVTAIETHLPRYAPDFSTVHRIEVLDADGNIFR